MTIAAPIETITGTIDGESLPVKQLADSPDQQHFVVLIISAVPTAFGRL